MRLRPGPACSGAVCRTIAAVSGANIVGTYIGGTLEILPGSSLVSQGISLHTDYGVEPRSNISYIIIDQVLCALQVLVMDTHALALYGIQLLCTGGRWSVAGSCLRAQCVRCNHTVRMQCAAAHVQVSACAPVATCLVLHSAKPSCGKIAAVCCTHGRM